LKNSPKRSTKGRSARPKCNKKWEYERARGVQPNLSRNYRAGVTKNYETLQKWDPIGGKVLITFLGVSRHAEEEDAKGGKKIKAEKGKVPF